VKKWDGKLEKDEKQKNLKDYRGGNTSVRDRLSRCFIDLMYQKKG